MSKELYNNTRIEIDLGGGFVVPPEKSIVVPAHVARHPYTKVREKLGDLTEPPKVITNPFMPEPEPETKEPEDVKTGPTKKTAKPKK